MLEPHRAERAAPIVLLTAPPGYGLRLPAGALDADAFAADLHAAEQMAGADPSRAVAHLDAGLAWWRGETYAAVACEPWAACFHSRSSSAEYRAGNSSTSYDCSMHCADGRAARPPNITAT